MFSKSAIRVLVFISAVFGFVFGAQTIVAAQTYSEEATLTDGVDGVDVNRSTTINARVWAIQNVGDNMLVGGAFLNVRDRSSFATIPRPYLAAFDPSSGEYVPDFLAQPNGTVYDIVDIDGQALLIGEFSSVNSVPNTHGLALVDPATGLVDTSLEIDLNNSGVIRTAAKSGNSLYVGGSFTSINVGGVQAPLTGLARIDLTTMKLDASFAPSVEGSGVWGIDVDSNGRVFAGGYFSSINATPDTETFAALNGDGSLVAGWNHGFPGPRCAATWSINCGAVNDLAVYGDKVFTAGAKHFWTAHATSDGESLAAKEISNDGQTVEVIDGMIVVGCHCSHSNSDEFPGVIDRYLRVIDPNALTEVESPTVNSKGGAGGWASAEDPRGCLWGGGQFSSSYVGGVQQPAWNLLRFCPVGVGSAQSVRTPATSTDKTPPNAPTNLTVAAYGSSVELAWNSNESQVGFVIMRDGVVVARTSGTSYQDLFVEPGIHNWQVAAYDMAGNVSLTSNASSAIEIAAPVNVALNATATSSSVADENSSASNAIDGNTDPLFANGSVARTDSGESWFNLDLGQPYNIDYIEIHPSENFGELNNRVRVYRSSEPILATNRVEAGLEGLRVWTGPRLLDEPRIERADLAAEAQYVRLLRTGRMSLSEIRVYATPASPTPATPPSDTEAPTGPQWKSVQPQENSTILRWGGATDNRGVVRYEVYERATGELVGRTIDSTFLLEGSDRKASEFTIVAYDAGGLDSGNIPTIEEEISFLACSAVRDGQTVEISWETNTDPDKFVIRRSINGGTNYWRSAPTGTDRIFTDTDRTGTIQYFIEARNGNTVVATLECDVTTEETEVLPEGLRSTFTDRSRIVLNWQSVGDVDIEVNGQIVAQHDRRWYTLRDLDPATAYTIRIRFAGSDSWSEPIVVNTNQ